MNTQHPKEFCKCSLMKGYCLKRNHVGHLVTLGVIHCPNSLLLIESAKDSIMELGPIPQPRNML